MMLGLGLGLTGRVFSGPAITVEDGQSVAFGAQTLEGAGGVYPPVYTGTINSVSLSGINSGHFEDDGNGRIVPSAAGVGNLSGPYSLTATYNGSVSVSLTITILNSSVNGDYSCRTAAEMVAAIAAIGTTGNATLHMRNDLITDFTQTSTASTFTDPVTISGGVFNHIGVKFYGPWTFDGIDLDTDAAVDTTGIDVQSTVVIQNSNLRGTAQGFWDNITYGSGGVGVQVDGGSLTMTGNTISRFGNGVVATAGSNHTITDNIFEENQSDDLDIWDTSTVTVGGSAANMNTFRKKLGVLYAIAHGDHIQVEKQSSDIPVDNLEISYNFIDYAPDAVNAPQGALISNAHVAGAGTFPTDAHDDGVISHNLIRGKGSHVLTIEGFNGLAADDNTIIKSYEDTSGTACSMTLGSSNGGSITFDNNVAPAFVDDSGNVNGTNLLVSNSLSYTGDNDDIYLFKNPQVPYDQATLSDFAVNPFGAAYKGTNSVFGSDLTIFDESLPSELTACALRKFTSTSGPLTVTVNASYSADASGLMTAGNATFSWDWGDGTSAGSGIEASHTYATTGTYTITLTVTRNSDSATATDTLTHIAYSNLFIDLAIDADGPTETATGYTLTQNGTETLVQDGSDWGIRITTGNELLFVDTGSFNTTLWEMPDWSVECDFARVSGDGPIFGAFSTVQLSISGGNLTFRADDVSTIHTISTTGLGLTDTNRHIVKCAYSANKNKMEIEVDGVVVASGSAGGVIQKPPSSSNHLRLGHPTNGTAAGIDFYSFKVEGLDNIGMTASATAPTLSSSTPADNATGVAVDADIILTFSKAVRPVTGSTDVITLHKTSDDSQVDSWSVIDDVTGNTKTGRIVGSGTTTLTLSLTSNLAASTEYYLLIPATALQDIPGNAYAGISSTTALSFTTA